MRDNELKEFEKAFNDIIDLLDDQKTESNSKSEEKQVKQEEKKEITKGDKIENANKSNDKK
jgi:hypothetical protein